MKQMVDCVVAWLLWKPLQAGPLAQVLGIEVWVPVVDHPGLKMPGSIVKANRAPVVVYWYILYIVPYINNFYVPAMYITVSLSLHRSS